MDIPVPAHPTLLRLVDVAQTTPSPIDNGSGCRPEVARPLEEAMQALVGRPCSVGGPCRPMDLTGTTTLLAKVSRPFYAERVRVTVMVCAEADGQWTLKVSSAADATGHTVILQATPDLTAASALAYEFEIGFGAGAAADVGVTDLELLFTETGGTADLRVYQIGVEPIPMTTVTI